MYKYISVAAIVIALTTPVQAAGDDVAVRLFNAQESLAARGDAQAQFYLGEMYEQGLGTAANPEQALVWYGKAAQQGHAMSKRKLKELSSRATAPAPASSPPPPATATAAPTLTAPPPAAPAKPGEAEDDAKEAARKQAEQARAAKLQAEQQASARRAKEAAEAADKEKRRAAAKAALTREKTNAKKYGTGY